MATNGYVVRTSNGVVQTTAKALSTGASSPTNISQLKQLTDVIHDNLPGMLEYDPTTQLFTLKRQDSQIFDVTVLATTVVDWTNGGVARLLLTRDTTITLSGIRGKGVLQITQGTGGGHVVTFDPATFGLGTDISQVSLSPTMGLTDYVGVIYNQATEKYDIVSVVRGYTGA